MFRWAIEHELIDDDPSRMLRLVKSKSEGFKPWQEADLARFERRFPIGTTARTIFVIALFTGLRRQDIARIGPQHRHGNQIRLTAAKNGVLVVLPILRELDQVLALSSPTQAVYVLNQAGQPFSAAGLGNYFRERCDEAGLTGLSLHGLRKAMAIRLAHSGATAHEIMAIGGWNTLKEAERYTRAAERVRLAQSGMRLISGLKDPHRLDDTDPHQEDLLPDNDLELRWRPVGDPNRQPIAFIYQSFSLLFRRQCITICIQFVSQY